MYKWAPTIESLPWDTAWVCSELSCCCPHCHLLCDSTLDSVIPEAFANKMQSILGVLFMWFAFLGVQLEVWIPVLPSNALLSGVSAGWLSAFKHTCQNHHCLGLRGSEWCCWPWEWTLHQADRVCALPRGGRSTRALRKAGDRWSGEEVTAHGTNTDQSRKAEPAPQAAVWRFRCKLPGWQEEQRSWRP